MSKSKIDVYSCERCKTAQELRQPHQTYDWGEFWAAQCNGPIWFGSQKKNDRTLDLCPGCMASLKVWFNRGTELIT
jgi:hypothetical protein